MEKIMQQSNQICQQGGPAAGQAPAQETAAASDHPSMQAAKRRFSDEMSKPGSEKKTGSAKKKLHHKTQHLFDKSLHSVHQRLARDLQRRDRDSGGEHESARGHDSETVTNSAISTNEGIQHPIRSVTGITTASPAVHDISNIAQQIADRVLVTSPDSNANQEVRIQLNSSFLDGSDVRIFRDNGELKVVFVANTKDAENFISQNKGHIEQALSERLKDERIHVNIEPPGGRDSGGERNEGRSRQEYIVADDAEEDA